MVVSVWLTYTLVNRQVGSPRDLGVRHIWCWDKAQANSDSHDTPRPELGRCHHHPPYSILCATPPPLHPNGTFSRDSQNGVPKMSRFWTPGTLGHRSVSPQPSIGTRFEPSL
jgi:hypothetical protein